MMLIAFAGQIAGGPAARVARVPEAPCKRGFLDTGGSRTQQARFAAGCAGTMWGT